MKIIYSPYYGSRPYVNYADRGGVLFGEKAVGSAGLLDELELRTGLSREEIPEMDRLISYVKAMRKALDETPGLFFADSFGNDELGTARVILSWRDTLVMAMWTPDMDATDKLAGIAATERHFRAAGYPDRWRRVASLLKEDRTVLPDLELECRVPMESLEPVIREALAVLEEGGMTVVAKVCDESRAGEGTALWMAQDALLGRFPGTGKTKLPDDGSFRLIDFGFGYDAHQWAAQNSRGWAARGDLLVNPAPQRMNDTLRVMGRATLRSSIEGAPQSAQLFLLGLSLFRNPVDVGRLLSYLRAKVSPIGKLCVKKEPEGGDVYYRSLPRELTDRLLLKGGLDGWPEIIAGAVYDHEGNVLEAKTRDEVLSRFLMWEKVSLEGLVDADDLKAYLKSMRRWADGCAVVLPDDPGYRVLSNCCAAVETLIEDVSGSIRPERIMRWAEGVFTAVGTTVDVAESGSPDCVRDVREMVDSPEGVVWMGFNGSAAAAYPYAFLSVKECALVGAPSREDFARHAHEAMVAAVCMVKDRLTLVSWDQENGEACAVHPLRTELDEHFELEPEDGISVDPLEPAEYDTFEAAPDETRQVEYEIDKNLFKGLDKTRSEGGIRPDRESYSSLDKLIQHPFDYVMDYLLRFDGYGEAELNDVQTAKGNVAHFYVQTLIEKQGHDLDRMEAAHRDRFDETVLACAERKGAVLLMEENGLEWGKFRHMLRRSVKEMLSLIRLNGLAIEGTEMRVETVFPVIGPFLAFIDLVLRDPAGNYVVFDLKWSEGKYYETRMEGRDILQLILYKEALERSTGTPVSALGYWVFPRYEFLTECPSIVGDGVVHYRCEPGEAPVADIFEQACNSYTFRMDQIREGIIEEGEGFVLSDFEYFASQMERNLYPLRGDYYEPSVKGSPYGNENITIKGGLL